MGNFKGIVTHQTLSDEDFNKLMTMPIEEIEKWSTVGVKIVENADILYKEMACSIADVIIKNNKQNKSSSKKIKSCQ